MKRLLILIIFLIIFGILIFKCPGTIAHENIIPGDNISLGYLIAKGEKYFLLNEGLNEACSPAEGNYMFCVVEKGKYQCTYWKGVIKFTFLPVQSNSTSPFKAIGHSSDKKRFPIKEYTIGRCKN